MWRCSGKRGERLGYIRSESDPELRFSFLFNNNNKKKQNKNLSITGQNFLSVLKKAATVDERDNYGAETVNFLTANNYELKGLCHGSPVHFV